MTAPKQAKARSWVAWANVYPDGRTYHDGRAEARWQLGMGGTTVRVRITVIARRGRGKGK